MEKNSSCNNVCVTGASGFIGSSLVNKLLHEGYTVHATLRNLNDHHKVDILKSFSWAEERLKLFEADIYKADEFETAIRGCDFVFHVATPLLHTEGQKYKDKVEATVEAAKSIATSCIKSKTVKRLIYTATAMAASPLKDDCNGFKKAMDETCWTPHNLTSVPYIDDFGMEYIQAKTLAEKELLSLNNNSRDTTLEVISLACGLVGGKTLMPSLPGSVTLFVAQLTNDEFAMNSLKFLRVLLGKIPIVHIEDACDAHIFCMKEQTLTSGRYLCANAYVSTADIARYYQKRYPEFDMRKEHLDCEDCDVIWGSNLLNGKGFEYKYDMSMVLDDSLSSAKSTGYI